MNIESLVDYLEEARQECDYMLDEIDEFEKATAEDWELDLQKILHERIEKAIARAMLNLSEARDNL